MCQTNGTLEKQLAPEQRRKHGRQFYQDSVTELPGDLFPHLKTTPSVFRRIGQPRKSLLTGCIFAWFLRPLVTGPLFIEGQGSRMRTRTDILVCQLVDCLNLIPLAPAIDFDAVIVVR